MKHYDFGKNKWVFVDWMGIDPGYGTAWSGDESIPGENQPVGIELKVHRPRVEPGWVVAPELPWEKMGVSPYASFLEDRGRFHCWYECYGSREDMGIKVNVAYAVSDDGIHWEKPGLDVCKLDGSTENNLTSLQSHGACVFIDPTAPPEERFKSGGLHIVSPETPDTSHTRPQCKSKWWRQVGGALSADGFRWRPCTKPILPRQFCDTQTVITYDNVLRKYVLFTRQKDGLMKRRGISRSESEDFLSFPPSKPIFESSPLDPPDWDFQSHGYHQWPGAPHTHLMLPTIFYRTSDSMAIHFAASRDGVQWHRPQGPNAWLSVEDIPGETEYAWVHSCHGILSTADGEWSIYFRPYYHGHNENKMFRKPSGLMRAVLREDGFMSLNSPGHGEFWTVPFVMERDSISLNVKCGYAGFIRIGLERVLGDYDNVGSVEAEPIPGFDLDDCGTTTGDHIKTMLNWRSGGLKSLQGQTVRLHIQMFKTELFALRFLDNTSEAK